MPEIPELSVVRLTEAVEGIEAGSYGTVVHVYQGSAFAETGYAVEFSNPSRIVVVARSQIEPDVWTEDDLRAADAKAEELHRYFHPEEYTERAMLRAAQKEAVIAWSVCASIHRKFGKDRDALYTTRQADFVKHEAVARAALDDSASAKASKDHTERARRVIALVENCAGDTALLVGAVAAEFSAVASEYYADEACEQRVAGMVQEFLDCAKYDALMEGPLFRTWDRSALDRLRKKYEAMLATAFSAPQ